MPRANQYNDSEDMFADTRMSFGDHIEELRTHLLRALAGLPWASLSLRRELAPPRNKKTQETPATRSACGGSAAAIPELGDGRQLFTAGITAERGDRR